VHHAKTPTGRPRENGNCCSSPSDRKSATHLSQFRSEFEGRHGANSAQTGSLLRPRFADRPQELLPSDLLMGSDQSTGEKDARTRHPYQPSLRLLDCKPHFSPTKWTEDLLFQREQTSSHIKVGNTPTFIKDGVLRCPWVPLSEMLTGLGSAKAYSGGDSLHTPSCRSVTDACQRTASVQDW